MGAVSAIELDAPAAPVASIPIVTTLAGSLVRGCIERLAEIAPETPFETIVVLNGADPGEAQRLRVETSGVRIVESEVNLGSAGGLNLARPFARGEYLVSLHDDARPAPGWLDALIRAAESEPDAGAVGSLVLNRDGSVQAAGWHLLPDGSTRPPWSGDPPPPSAFTTRRAVDYAPMCSILIRARAWD